MQIICCPQCKRKVFSYNGHTSMIQYGKCRRCDKMVCFNPITGEVTIKAVPQRTTSSGMTFI